MSKKHGGHHGGSWKVAYADFVTAMMALFLCLWLTAQDTKIKDAVERAFRNPFSAVNKESTGIIPQSESTAQFEAKGNFESANALESEMLRHLTEDLAKILQGADEDQNSVKLDLTPEGLRISIFDRSRKPIFERDSDVLTGYGAWVFSTLAWEISRYETFRIELEGHTDAGVAAGQESHTNWELSADRANSARRKLVQSGVTPAQVYKVSGFADTQPMPDELPTAEVNSRVTVTLKLDKPDARTGSARSSHAPQS